MKKQNLVYWLRRWIPNPMVLCSKQPCGSKVEPAFHPFEVDQMGTRNFSELSDKKLSASL